MPESSFQGVVVEIAPVYESDSPKAIEIRRQRALARLATDLDYFDGYEDIPGGGKKNFTYGFDSPEEQAELRAEAAELLNGDRVPLSKSLIYWLRSD